MGKVFFMRRRPEDILEEHKKILEEMKQVSKGSPSSIVFEPEQFQSRPLLELPAVEEPEAFIPKMVAEEGTAELKSVSTSTDQDDEQKEKIIKLRKQLKRHTNME
jgi:hypothetical protein